MKYSFVFTALSALSIYQVAQGLPAKRSDGITDADVLNFALTLEHLENEFYNLGLQKYSAKDFEHAGYPAWVRGRFEQIAVHEKTHVEFLSSALSAAGVSPVQACEYEFPLNGPKSFVALSETLESVGTSAYTGAASLISNKEYLTAAASILTVEGRQAAWVNSAVLKQNPWGSSFETPLDINQAFTLASGFIKSCPSTNTALPAKAFPALTVPTSARPGQQVTLTFSPADNASQPLYAAFISGLGTQIVPINDKKQVTIPNGLMGNVYVVVSTDGDTVADNTTAAGPALVIFDFDSTGKVVS